MATKLRPGDRVKFTAPNSRLRLTAIVADFLDMPTRGEPYRERSIPIQRGKYTKWMPRRMLRKLPDKPKTSH